MNKKTKIRITILSFFSILSLIFGFLLPKFIFYNSIISHLLTSIKQDQVNNLSKYISIVDSLTRMLGILFFLCFILLIINIYSSKDGSRISFLRKLWLFVKNEVKISFINEINISSFSFTLICTTIVMFIAHAFAFFTVEYTHDSIGFFDVSPITLGMIGLGRWLSSFYPALIQGPFGAPWICGLISIFFTALSIHFVNKILKFGKLQTFISIIVLTTNIVMIAGFATWIHSGGIWAISFCLAALSAYYMISNNSIGKMFLSSLFLALSIAMDQAYVCVTIGILLIFLLKKVFSEKVSWYLFFKQVGKFFLSGVIGVVIYLIIMKLSFVLFKIDVSAGYNSPARLKDISLGSIIKTIPIIYKHVAEYFVKPTTYNKFRLIMSNISYFVCSTILIVRKIKKEKSIRQVCQILLILIILPLGVGCIELVSMGVMHQLMMFAYNFLYLIPLSIFSSIDSNIFISSKQKIPSTLFVFTLIIGWSNILFANAAYTEKKLVYDNTVAHMNYIWKDINSIPEYEAGKTPVEIIGYMEESVSRYEGPIYHYFDCMVGNVSSSVTYDATFKLHMLFIEGKNMNIIYNNPDLVHLQDIIDMPKYPKSGYCIYKDDKVIVKLSD